MKKIKLTKGKYALVDDSDFDWLNGFNWFANEMSHGKYRVMRNKTKSNPFIYMHRMVLGLSDTSKKIDHKDRNPLNNQRDNLRICNDRQNACNTTSAKNSTSKYLGVCLSRQEQKYKTKKGWKISKSEAWRATIFKDRKQIDLGRFKNEKDAARAYNEAAIIYHGEFANLNIIT